MRRHPILGAVDVLVAVGGLVAIWAALPARWWPVDVGGTAVALAFAASGTGLLLGKPWGQGVGRVVAGVILVLGLSVVTAIAVTASHVAGLYGPVGRGGALILLLVAALLLPYTVGLPAAQLFILRPQPAPTPAPAPGSAPGPKTKKPKAG